MDLTVYDRILLSNMIPQNAQSFIDGIVYSDVKDKIQLTSDELDALGFTQEGGNMQWSEEKAADHILEGVELNNLETEKLTAAVMDNVKQRIDRGAGVPTSKDFFQLMEKVLSDEQIEELKEYEPKAEEPEESDE